MAPKDLQEKILIPLLSLKTKMRIKRKRIKKTQEKARVVNEKVRKRTNFL